jgi:hypothetical protein
MFHQLYFPILFFCYSGYISETNSVGIISVAISGGSFSIITGLYSLINEGAGFEESGTNCNRIGLTKFMYSDMFFLTNKKCQEF